MKAFKSDAMRFTMPVIAENIFTTGVGLIYSAIVGGISASSLAAMGTGNQAINLVVALFAVITTGGVVLTAQLTGRSDIPRASRVVEHTLLLAPASALVITVVLLAVSAPLMRLLMPGAQADFVKESTDYFRMLLLSLPGLITMNALTGLLRASGESRIALLNSILINVVQIAAAYLFINRMGMKIMGAGCAYVACRYAGAIAMVIAVFGHHRGFRVEPSRIFRPSMPVVREILRVGLPTSVDSFSVQAGYLLNNSLLIGLGVRAASTYNVIATIVTLTGICQGIGNTSAATLVGQKVGAGDLPGARRRMNAILLYTFIATTVLCLVACLFPRFFAGLFSSDPDVISDSVRIMWLILPFCYVAVSVNVTEPATRAGGDTKYVMLTCSGCVWLIRLPLTWLFCYPLKMGVAGVWLANMVSLVARTVFCLARVYGRKWGQKPL